ncbi:unnamed protein product [Pedinophyceae sp. YPF-701]|nr:unnamed protein product [Pedinophyceae sp. YPF-701]
MRPPEYEEIEETPRRVCVSAPPWVHRKIINPLLGYLQQGTDPSTLAWSVAWGFNLGLCPLLGISTPVCLLAAYLAGPTRLHSAAMLVGNVCSIPFEVLLIVPYIRLGGAITGSEAGANFSPVSVWQLLKHAPAGALEALLVGIFAWALLLVPLVAALAFALKPAMRALSARIAPDGDAAPLFDTGLETSSQRGATELWGLAYDPPPAEIATRATRGAGGAGDAKV